MLKKGSISLSINMIVVVVLAFVMLGLMLTLGRNIVESAGDTAAQVSEQTRQNIINELIRSDEPLYFTQRLYDVPFGKDLNLMFGIKNVAPTNERLLVAIAYIDPYNGNLTVVNPKTPSDQGSFQWDVGASTFRAGEGKPFDVVYTAPRDQDTFQFRFIVFRMNESNAPDPEPVAEQTITVQVI